MWVPLGSMFSFIEVLPLVLLIIEAIGAVSTDPGAPAFNYTLAYTYIIGAAFWNFVGAGVFGGTLNAPLINYYEHGTFLTLNHATRRCSGRSGCSRSASIYSACAYAPSARLQRTARFVGLLALQCRAVMWILLNFFPIGWPQLNAVFEHGLAYARR